MVGRCEMFDEIAHGEMATIHLGRMLGAGGFTRTVAIKRLHPQFALDQDFATRLRDEAHILARIRHPNVVPTLDVVDEEGNVFLIMEYVEGLNLTALLKAAEEAGERLPPPVAMRIAFGVLHGLSAAHEATSEKGEPLKLVHRNVTPSNIMVGADGFPRLLDFGTARALGRLSTSRTGQTKRQPGYMAPEQVRSKPLDQRADVFAVSAVIWEMLTGKKLFGSPNPVELIKQITEDPIIAPSSVVPELPRKWDRIVLRGLERDPTRRWRSAVAMADAIEAIGGLAVQREVGDLVRRLGAERLAVLAAKLKALEAKPVRKATARRVQARSRLAIDTDKDELRQAIARAEAELARRKKAEQTGAAAGTDEIEAGTAKTEPEAPSPRGRERKADADQPSAAAGGTAEGERKRPSRRPKKGVSAADTGSASARSSKPPPPKHRDRRRSLPPAAGGRIQGRSLGAVSAPRIEEPPKASKSVVIGIGLAAVVVGVGAAAIVERLVSSRATEQPEDAGTVPSAVTKTAPATTVAATTPAATTAPSSDATAATTATESTAPASASATATVSARTTATGAGTATRTKTRTNSGLYGRK